MKIAAITQRVDIVASYGERRDALDQQWTEFLAACKLVPLPIPNDRAVAATLIARCPPDIVVLTGGNDLGAYGGDAPERDATEQYLLEHCMQNSVPVLGVCRGMQLILHHFGARLERVEGHVQKEQEVLVEGTPRLVNSYHNMAALTAEHSDIEVWARAQDGVVKAVRHRQLPLQAVMWHPERMAPFATEDLALVEELLRA